MNDAILIVGHGSESLASTSAPIRACVRRLRLRGLNASCAFWKGTPNLRGAIERTWTDTDTIVVVPFFMADGYYTQIRVPEALELSAGRDVTVRYTAPVGVHPEIARLAAARIEGRSVTVIGHGTKRSKTSTASTFALVSRLEELGLDARAGFVDDDPRVNDVVRAGDLLLPFFAANSGHVVEDIRAQFPNHLCLDPVGLWPKIDDIVLSCAEVPDLTNVS